MSTKTAKTLKLVLFVGIVSFANIVHEWRDRKKTGGGRG